VRTIITPLLRWLFRRVDHSHPVSAQHVRRILILRYDAIGDMIVTIPMIDFLRAVCPNAQIDVISSPANHSIATTVPDISCIPFARTLRSYFVCWWALRKRHYDVTYSLVINKTTLAGWLSNTLGKSAVTVSFEHPERRHIYSVWFNHQIPQVRGTETMTIMQLRLAGASLGIVPDTDRFPLRLTLSNEARAFASEQRDPSAQTIVLNISAGNSYRMWTEERNAALIDGLMSLNPAWRVSIVGHGPRLAMAERLAQRHPQRCTAVPGAPFLHVAAICEDALMLISPDTSMIHAASALGTPVIGLYTRRATFINEWMPHGVPFEAVVTNQAADLESIAPSDVLDAVNRLAQRL